MRFFYLFCKFEGYLCIMLYRDFLSFNRHNHLFSENDKIILAVSGGIDSMTLLWLFAKTSLNCVVAHCNFSLRGEESDGDEAFVKQKAEEYGFPCFCQKFDTTGYAESNKISIQMAARELRYNWFRQLKKETQSSFIAVAHNRDDALETFFINLGRGTGIKGLISIQPKSEDIIRPLLYATRAQITAHSEKYQILFREDSSNKSDKYTRNFIRHKIIPSFEELYPAFRDTAAANIDKLNDISQLYDYSLKELIPKVFSRGKSESVINIQSLLKCPAPKTILFEILNEFGFTSPSIAEIFESCQSISGKQFFSTTHSLIKDRDTFIIVKTEKPGSEKFYIDDFNAPLTFPVQLEFLRSAKDENFEIIKDAHIAFLDFEKIEAPVILRKWQTGDYFIPLGMKGMKKVSDFFIDQKMSLVEKNNTWLLTSGKEVMWIVGSRIDNRFKVTEQTKEVLKIIYRPF